MKVFKLIFGVCLGVLALHSADAMADGDVARAATRRGVQNSVTQSVRGTGQTASRNNTSRTTVAQRETARNTAKPRQTTATKVVSRNQNTGNVVSRTTVAPSRTVKPQSTRVPARTGARSATPQSRGAVTAAAARNSRNMVRAATDESGIRTTQYQKCREIYYDCMDEFCANKDSNLRRCACSARATEFDGVKQQMSQFEDKMLDFNQRLLMVNMDAQDVEAINTATIGEDTFYATNDKTKSKKALDEITKKLNKNFADDTSGTSSLAPIALSLNADTAFDSVDSLMGAQTTTKSGVALYNAALPVCREMAMEVCTDQEFALATSGYQMQIEQDCNTVSKAYQSQVDQARTKVLESSALLDISRLDAYQTRNSDDILTCKRKMMELLTDSAVCGTNMEKCLDITGRYIDPTTGSAFLTSNLSDLDTLISRPDAGQTWTEVNSGNAFLTFLKGKKTYLESATKNCQDIADRVWDAFIEDALAQIKLAQGAKLQEVRQACTTLTTECMTNASESLTDFDARALSIFGIAATRTAISMCTDVKTACEALLGADGDTSWATGMSDANTIKTYDSIISSCNLVGQNCIIQACRSTSGNFGLCEDMQFAANRHAILERTSCWNEVLDCVASAGDDSILSTISLLGKTITGTHKYAFYDEMYGTRNPFPIYDICESTCANDSDIACARCRIAERIWGNCQYTPSSTENDQNQILTSGSVSTLLMWFAKNTNSADDPQNCVNVRCTAGNKVLSANGMVCISDDQRQYVTDDGRYCPVPPSAQMTIVGGTDGLTNCCFNNTMVGGVCCEHGTILSGANLCVPSGVSQIKTLLTRGTKRLVCIGANSVNGGGDTSGGFPNGDEVRCNGTFIMVDDNKIYTEPTKSGTGTGGGVHYTPQMYYYDTNGTAQTLTQTGTANQWFIGYN